MLSLKNNLSVHWLYRLVMMTAIWVTPTFLRASPPAWWSTRGVLDTTKQANDYAAVNQGQLKNIADQARQEMEEHIPGGAGDAVTTLTTKWLTSTAASNDFAPVNLGMLKTVAQPFYDRLKDVGYINNYPWTGHETLANDFAAANIGQVKNLFSFDLSLDEGNGLLPIWWELKYFGSTNVDPNALAPGGSGLTNLQEYQLGLNPNVAYTMGDSYTDGWKVSHNLNPHHKMVADTNGTVLALQVFTPLD